MKTKTNTNSENHLIFTTSFNNIEQNISDENKSVLESYMKEVDNALDNIYLSNELFNPDVMLKYLYNQKYRNKFANKKKKIKKIKSTSPLKDKNKLFNTNTKFNHRNNKLTIISKFDSYDENINKRNKNINIGFNTINNFNNKKIFYDNINENDDSDNTIKKTKNENNNEEEKIITALKKNKINLLKLHRKKFIKEFKKEKKLNEIDEEIDNKTKTLFYNIKIHDKNKDINNLNEKVNEKKKKNEKINSKLKKNWKYQSTDNFNKLSNLYRNCIKNLKFDKNFANIINYVNKQRLSQYKINNLRKQIKSEEDILYRDKKLLKDQSKEIDFHKRELIRREEKEQLYNLFKKEIRERFIHKNLKIDVITKISNKFAYLGRDYFFKNFDYNYLNDEDFLFEDNLPNEKNKIKKKRFYKAASSCNKVISNIEKMAKQKKEIMKRIKDDEEKYNKNENGYYFCVENKELIKKPIYSLSRNKKNRFIDNDSYDDEKEEEKIKLSNLQIKKKKMLREILLPKIKEYIS